MLIQTHLQKTIKTHNIIVTFTETQLCQILNHQSRASTCGFSLITKCCVLSLCYNSLCCSPVFPDDKPHAREYVGMSRTRRPSLSWIWIFHGYRVNKHKLLLKRINAKDPSTAINSQREQIGLRSVDHTQPADQWASEIWNTETQWEEVQV